MAKVTIRYWAAAKEAAGIPEEQIEADTLAMALELVQAMRPRLRDVVARSSFLVNGTPSRRHEHAATRLADGAIVEVLPPFAGG